MRYSRYRYLFVFAVLPVLASFALMSNQLIANTEEYVPSDITPPEINNDSLQKMFIRVEILQRRNQEYQNRLEQLENQNSALTERLKELSVEFDTRIESLSYEYREFRKEVENLITEKNNPTNNDEVLIDLKTQDIYRQGIVAISLEQYDKAIDFLNEFIAEVDPKAEQLTLKARYWMAVSLSKLQRYQESYPIFFDLEQSLKIQ